MDTKLQINFFYLLLIAVAVLTAVIFLPYFKPLLLAVVLAITFGGVYRTVLLVFGKYRSIASLVTVVFILVVILLPISILGYYFFNEAKGLYVSVVTPDATGLTPIASLAGKMQVYLNKILPDDWVPETTVGELQNIVQGASSWFVSHLRGIFSSVLSVVINLFIMILALFFFLRDGERFKEFLIKLSPLSDAYDEGILHKMKVAINSVVRGNLFIAIVQGILATIGFVIFGVPSPVLWGSFAIVAAVIPSVGTSVVMIPAVIYLLSAQGGMPALGLLLWGFVIVGLIDNLLRPFILKRGIHIHPFLILLSVFGGIGFFGPIGFVMGPIIVSLLFALVDIYPKVTEGRSEVSDKVN